LAQRSWAADSSGEFLATNYSDTAGLTFFDRATGTAISFGEEFGFVTAVGVRHPEALLAG
jgi:hypothetical protein